MVVCRHAWICMGLGAIIIFELLSSAFWTFPQHDPIIPGGLFSQINVGVCTGATRQRPGSTMETNPSHRYRLVHMTGTKAGGAPSLKGNKVVSRIFELPCEACLTSAKKEAFRNSSLLFLALGLFCAYVKQKTKGTARPSPHFSVTFPAIRC